ncbi:serpentine type 7TM GPCR chemoreceptor srh domain-containing protein [Ditylenchus destructor]|uniref:Serpentine type 7TM GPCR chemoreceptor srh domain-containing protein n=1 Tax=Ditylenchus destructor TaxID=166010 RepID=A0AAD4MVJ8_9BILA|nr:serpentine type 7TM GPCR chemoreceptor srh domain-containing protein [Ditylenchus destructor]
MSSGDLNSTYHQAFLVSDIVSFISALAVYIIFALLLTSYIVVVWVCLKKSPSSMRSYKWLIITNATNALVFEGLIVLFQPEFLLPYPVVLINGIGKFLARNDSIPIITYIFCDLAIITLLGNGVFVVSLFVFRYCQTTNHFLYHRLLTDMRLCIPFLVIGLITVSLQYIVFANNLLVVPKDFLRDLKEVDPEVYSRIKGRHMVVLKEFRTSHFTYLFVETTLLLYIAAFSFVVPTCIFGCYRFLIRHKSILTTKTMSLFLALINSLVLELALQLFLVVIPVSLMVVGVIIDSPYTAIVSAAALPAGSLYPVAANVIVIVFVGPYRRAVLKLGRGVFGKSRHLKTEVFTFRQRTQPPIKCSYGTSVNMKRAVAAWKVY